MNALSARFAELTDGFAREAGLPCVISDDGRTAELAPEGVHVHLACAEEAGLVYFQAGCALAPAENDPDRARFLAKLLSANNLFAGTQGFTLGLDGDLVTVQYACEIAPLDAERFSTLIQNLLTVCADWSERLGSADDAVPPGSAMLPDGLSV